MTAHSIDEERFAIALTERGWKLDSSYGWVKQSGAQRAQMERDWREALLAAVQCPYETITPPLEAQK